MKLYKRGTKWYADLRQEGQGRVATGCTDKQEARKAAKRLIDGGKVGKKMTEALERSWKDHYAATRGARNAVSIHRQLLQELGHEPVEALSTRKLRQYVDSWRAGGNSNGTINRKLSHVQKTLRIAVELGWLDYVPQIPRQKEAGARHREMSVSEEYRMLTKIEPWMAPLVQLLVQTGARLGEALKVTEVDRARALLNHVWLIRDTKSGKDRSVPLTERAVKAMVAWSWRGKSARQCQQAWDKVRDEMGLQQDPAFVIHCLRHTCASRLLQGGEPIEKVSKWLGHATIAVTQRYAHLRVEDLRSGVSVLESVSPGVDCG